MIDPSQLVLFIPDGLKNFKQILFNRIGHKIERCGGGVIRGNLDALANVPSSGKIPIVGCTPALRTLIDNWQAKGKDWIYWDRGYARRVFATWLPRGDNGGYYRWHRNTFQLREIRSLPDDRWKALNIKVEPWRKPGDHIVIAAPSETYCRFHRIEKWLTETVETLGRITKRRLVVRHKESSRSLQQDIEGAHALVTHGSIAAVESVILGCPVFVHQSSAAGLVGQTDLRKIETPVRPERTAWLNSLAYSQFNEVELIDGTLFRLLC